MATVAELRERIYRIELERARALAAYRAADQKLIRANDRLRDAMIVAARDPKSVGQVARLQTGAELKAEVMALP